MPPQPITTAFADVPDPRRETGNKLHALVDIRTIAVCAVISGADRDNATGCLCVVSAWATANHLTLGQVVVPDGTNEVGVIQDLLRALDLAGAIVTTDAAGCQIGNAATIRDRGGHDLLAVKGNPPGLHAAVRAVFDRACAADFAGLRCDRDESIGEGPGRAEERHTTVISDPVGLPADGADVAAVVQVSREREVGGVNTRTAHYYVTSYPGTAAEIAGWVRGHWGIENGLHWVLDVAFREDESRTRNLNAGANLALLRRVAVSLLKRVEAKGVTRRMMAAGDDDFLLRVLQGIPATDSA